MLAYDATLAMLQGVSNVLINGKMTLTPDDLRQGLTEIRGTQALQGVTGQISFSSNGDPIQKAVLVLYVDKGYIKVVANTGVQGCFRIGTCDNTTG